MKARALYHVLLTSARSARELVDPASRAAIDSVTTTLSVERPSKDGFLLSWTEGETRRTLHVPSEHFRFYQRGDVESIVARRAPGLDARADNWLQAHRVWGDIVGSDALRHLAAAPSLAMPVHLSDQRVVAAGPAVSVAVAMCVAGLALLTSPSATIVGVATALAAALLGHRLGAAPVRTSASVLVGTLAGTAWCLAAHPAIGPVRAAAGGVALLLASGELLPATLMLRARMVSLGAAAAVIIASSTAPWPFLGAAGLIIGADAVAMALRTEPARRRHHLGVSTLAVLGVVIVRLTMTQRPSLSSAHHTPVWVSLALAALLLLGAAFAATNGVLDRLSGAFSPALLAVLCAIVAVTTGGGTGTSVALMAAVVSMAVRQATTVVGATQAAPADAPRPGPGTQTPTQVPAAVRVSIGSRPSSASGSVPNDAVLQTRPGAQANLGFQSDSTSPRIGSGNVPTSV